jgi:diacylglycerol kinase (ATP)
MANQNAKGWRRVIYAFGYSMKGFKACFELEEAFRQEVFLLIPLIPLGLWLGETPRSSAPCSSAASSSSPSWSC